MSKCNCNFYKKCSICHVKFLSDDTAMRHTKIVLFSYDYRVCHTVVTLSTYFDFLEVIVIVRKINVIAVNEHCVTFNVNSIVI